MLDLDLRVEQRLAQRDAGRRLERTRPPRQGRGGAFRNLHPIAHGLIDPSAERPTLAEFRRGGNRRVPLGPLPADDPREAWRRKPGSGLRATWLGHSTVLIEIDGLRVLTEGHLASSARPARSAPAASSRPHLAGAGHARPHGPCRARPDLS